jgi:hypothetical protein
MKFTVTMKDPDGLDTSIDDAIQDDESLLEMAKDEQKAVIGARKQRMRDVCKRWFEYGEYIRIEIDVEAGTATVLDRV